MKQIKNRRGELLGFVVWTMTRTTASGDVLEISVSATDLEMVWGRDAVAYRLRDSRAALARALKDPE